MFDELYEPVILDPDPLTYYVYCQHRKKLLFLSILAWRRAAQPRSPPLRATDCKAPERATVHRPTQTEI